VISIRLNVTRACIGFAVVWCCVFASGGEAAAADAQSRARQILAATGVKGGLVVHLGCGDPSAPSTRSGQAGSGQAGKPLGPPGGLTAALRANDSYLVHGLETDAKKVEAAREHIHKLGLYGKVSVERFDGKTLPYADNLVNLLVAEDLGQVPMAEVMRVLAPNGVAYVKKEDKWSKTVKPRPRNIDEWTHYMYDASNNAVARDTVVGPPRRIQWKAGPTFARHHDVLASISAVVSAGGRVFYVIDEGPTSLMSFPAKWRLVARDAFNGVLLWKRPIPTWANYLRSFRSGPPQLPRRLVASGPRVYVTLGLDAPVTQLDAATGAVLKTYKGTEGTDEIILHDGRLLLVTIDPKAVRDAKSAGRRGVAPPQSPRRVMAVEAESGNVLWQKSGAETAGLRPMTLAAAAGRAVFQCGREVRCVDAKTGKALWRRDVTRTAKPPAPKKPRKRPRKPRRPGGWGASYYAPTLVVSSEYSVVLWADLGTLTALDLKTGKPLWSCPCKPDFRAPADVFLADGLVWAGLFAADGRDPRTGKIKRKLDIAGLLTPGHHPRCYRNKATERYIISDKRGTEFFDLRSGGHSRNNWSRGACQYGIMPCNGLTYLPPNACCCYAGAMLHGFYALAGAGPKHETASPNRLEKGPAYGKVNPQSASAKATADKSAIRNPQLEDWPTLRGSEMRGGSTRAPVPASPAKLWATTLGPKLTAPVVAGGKVVVASVHLGRITALNSANGKPLWSYVAGGRVDSPPTIHNGMALFGCADGWVYCLDASDGKLAWRFRAAPEDTRVVVDEQLESVWPVHGNILVLNGVAYLAAGRSCYLDGGIYLYALDPATGRKLHETRVVIPHEKDRSKAFIMAGAKPDVLVTDGKYVYLQQIKFDKRLARQKGFGRHLMNHSGLTDDTWFYRTFWRLGYGDSYDFPNSYIKHDLRVPFGQLLVFDDRTVCGLQTHFSPGIVPGAVRTGSRGCLLFGDPNRPFTPDEKTQPEADYPTRTRRPRGPGAHKWTLKLPFQARAMVLAGRQLFVAGWPDVIDPKDPFAAIEGRKGGLLWTFAASDGKKIAEQKLQAPPVFDGLIAAGGRLYMTTLDGKVICLGKGK